VEARSDHFGIALLSREPLERVRTVWLGSAKLPTVVAELRHGGRPLLLVGTHPPPPGNRSMATLRNEQLAAVASFVRQQTIPAVVAGDLNATSYSPFFQNLCASAGLRDSRQGFGIQASWTPRLPVLELAIDHCLVPPAIHVADRRVGPHLGSDHRPVQVRLTWTRDTQ
jgi:endonuclease/exonuclease/phosphatase (EEP) superfamily protein YafD